MKAGISNIWLLGIIIIFILVFAAYITISVNYTRSFKIKNEVLNIIEEHKGMTDSAGIPGQSKIPGHEGEIIRVHPGTLQTINLYLRGNNYTSMGNCSVKDDYEGTTWYGVKDLSNSAFTALHNYEVVQPKTKYYYCFTKIPTGNVSSGPYQTFMYRVRLFYKFELPAISEWLSIKVEGTTSDIYNVIDNF